MLVKTTKVLTHDDTVTGMHYFVQRDEDDRSKILFDMGIQDHLFEDLGRPYQITVTVEPGDTLNSGV